MCKVTAIERSFLPSTFKEIFPYISPFTYANLRSKVGGSVVSKKISVFKWMSQYLV